MTIQVKLDRVGPVNPDPPLTSSKKCLAPFETWKQKTQMLRNELSEQQPACEDINFWGSSALVIFLQRISDSLNKLISDKGVCRTTPATGCKGSLVSGIE